MRGRWRLAAWAFVTITTLCALENPAAAQHGIILSGGGPIGRSMGGTGTANPVDSLSVLFWNPAGLSALHQSEMVFGGEFLWARPNVASRLAANTFGPGVPPINLAGATDSDSATMILPNFGLAHHVENSDLTLGLGLISAAGLSSNYPASFTNPVLTPQPPLGFGIGRTYAELLVMQIVPSASLQLTDRLSVGFSPIINAARLSLAPILFAPPDDANGDLFFTYRSGPQPVWHWGAGFQLGAFYAGPTGVNVGVSFKSPQWFETMRFNSTDELGRSRVDTARFDLPWIASLGLSYTGWERWIFALDLRYIDYRNAEGFDATGFAPTGAVQGLGWDSQVVVAAGAQYRVSECFSVRGGYSWNNNPQDSQVAFFNIAAPTIIEHTVYGGASWDINHALTLSLAWVHAFESDVEGPVVLPLGAVPGSAVRSTVSADAFVMGFTVKY